MDLDLIQIHPGFEASKCLDFKTFHVLLQGNALFYILKLKSPLFLGDKNEMEEICPLNENVVERRWKYMRKRVQVPNHQTRFISCHISIRYITIGKHLSSIHKRRS
ncbi:uncharacterized protein LOC126702609 isoform X2 [Quercus robur]|uniref:uncharacterized protein LOC126702609 isoform X2 n=1 Tax=Quercus robur TaxID=38942 RepID=UPI0021634257|nr:uncharacterized protein LOC126702609 isoform X2 [Quercus robur]